MMDTVGRALPSPLLQYCRGKNPYNPQNRYVLDSFLVLNPFKAVEQYRNIIRA
jgi:hypothetical protein